MRWGGTSERVSVLVATGINKEGFRYVLACAAGFPDSAESWRGLLRGGGERERAYAWSSAMPGRD